MTAVVATLTSLPYTQFRKSRFFYLWYDIVFAVLGLSFIFWVKATGWQGLFSAEWDWRLVFFLPLVCHLQILCSVWIHNATHNNFPRAINRIVGELCGIVVLTRFASWEIIHQRHHKYSDDNELDPHPIIRGHQSYWRYVWRTISSVEHQLQQMFFELHGDTPENRRFQRWRAPLSFAVSFAIIPWCWVLLLGKPVFWILFFPAGWIGFFHLLHFNWSTHNPWSPTADYRPVNLNHGFYKIGNWLWHGIYWHGNHHQKTSLFNPGKMDADKALPVIKPGDATEHYPRKKTKAQIRAAA
jgi:stearoyl-CoA desaturase (delta-9 desaturase)